METTWDLAKARVNVARHGIAFEDAELTLSDPAGLTREDPDARGEARFVTVGADALGRIVTVVYAYRGDEVRLISARPATGKRRKPMRKEYDLADASRGAALKQPGKTRITIMLDGDVLAAFRARAADTGRGYQTAINLALREYLAADELEDTLRRVVREELRKAG